VLWGLVADGLLEKSSCVEFDNISACAPEAADIRLPAPDPHAPAMIQYTSGTTGLPKGAVLTHHNVANNSRIMALIKDQNSSTINLAIPPLFHTGGCVGGVLATVQTGGTILLPEEFDAGFMLDLVEQERATYMFGVPTMLIAMLEEQAHQPRDLSSLRTIFSGGTVVPVDVVKRVERVFAASLIIGYGMTESSPAITHTRPDDNAQDKSETIGYPIPQIDVKIINPDSQEITPINTPGELCTRGFHVMAGYLDLPDATAEAIDDDSWLHTGDLCTMDSRGYCRIVGRLKDMIIRGGENIYPREIEETFYEFPGVSEIAVFGVSDDFFGEVVAAAIIPAAGTNIEPQDLVAFGSNNLAKHKIPDRWYILPELPTTLSGKVRKVELRERCERNELEEYRIA
jgi:fatty-acyl-CoA synthase